MHNILSTRYGFRFSTKISGNLREFAGECNLGILYSSSRLWAPRRSARGAEGHGAGGLRPISVPRFWISEGFTQAES